MPKTLPDPVVIVLAAGQGTRFRASGGQAHKLDAALAGLPVLQHVIRAVMASGLPWHVVRHASGAGMGDSIAAGVNATVDAPGWLILPGDLPLVTPHSLRCVAQALATYTVVVPHWQQHRGHPVGFRAACRDALMQLSGEMGAASVVRHYRTSNEVLDLALHDRGIITDIDTVADLAGAESLLASRSRPSR